MTNATAEKPRKRAKPAEDDLEQKELPGIETVTNKKIRRLARQYKAAQRERMSALEPTRAAISKAKGPTHAD